MTNEEALNSLKDTLKVRTDAYYDYLQSGGKGDCAEEYGFDVLQKAIEALEKQIEYRWHNIVDNPTDTPDKYNCDWVLAQIVEDNGFVWIPKLAEFRVAKDDWYCDDANGWLNDSNGLFKVVAWCKLPTNDWSDSNE